MMQSLDRTLVRSPIEYRLCTSERMFRRQLKAIKRHKDYPFTSWLSAAAGACVHTLKDDAGDWQCIVCIDIDNRRDMTRTHAFLAHEAVHVWQEIKLHLGEKEPSAEFEAHAVQNIAEELFIAYARQSKKVKS